MLQVQYLHPKDGVYPEKVNAGRSAVNANKGRIGENLNPVQIKFSGKMVSVELHRPCSAGAAWHWACVPACVSDPNVMSPALTSITPVCARAGYIRQVRGIAGAGVQQAASMSCC
jgi:PsaD